MVTRLRGKIDHYSPESGHYSNSRILVLLVVTQIIGDIGHDSPEKGHCSNNRTIVNTVYSGAQQKKEAIQQSTETRSPHTTIQTTTSTESTSFRNNFPALHRLSDQSHFLLKKFKLKRSCFRLCYYDNSIYCCCYSDSSIDVYTLSGGFIRSIALSDIRDLRALHPLSTGLLVMASGNGLFIMSGDGGGITCIKKVVTKMSMLMEVTW